MTWITASLAYIYSGWQSLRLHPLRGVLTVLGIVFGVASVMAMLAVAQGASREALVQLQRLGTRNLWLYSQKPLAVQEQGMAQRSYFSVYGLRYDDWRKLQQLLPQARIVAVKSRQLRAVAGNKQAQVRLLGVSAGWQQVLSQPLLSGSWWPSGTDNAVSQVAVVSQGLRQELFRGRKPVGQVCRLGSMPVTVMGEVAAFGDQGATARAPDQKDDIYVPLELFRRYFGDIRISREQGSSQRERVELHQLAIQLPSQEQVPAAAQLVAGYLQRYHPQQDVAMQVPRRLLAQVAATKRRFNTVLGTIAAVSLLVGGIGIMNVMLATVSERRSEIGIRRAVGATQGQVLGQFLVETLVLTLSGGVLGLGLGFLVPWGISSWSGLQTVITWPSALLALAMSLLVGLLAGLYPARRAALLDPIAALRRN